MPPKPPRARPLDDRTLMTPHLSFESPSDAAAGASGDGVRGIDRRAAGSRRPPRTQSSLIEVPNAARADLPRSRREAG